MALGQLNDSANNIMSIDQTNMQKQISKDRR